MLGVDNDLCDVLSLLAMVSKNQVACTMLTSASLNLCCLLAFQLCYADDPASAATMSLLMPCLTCAALFYFCKLVHYPTCR